MDSSILISAERRRFDMSAFIKGEAAMDSVYITTVTASELLHGVHRASETYRHQRESFVEAVLRETPILTFDLLCARSHSKIWADLEFGGVRIGAHDMMIAASCLTFGHRLATLNESEFERVEGLVLADARKYVTG